MAKWIHTRLSLEDLIDHKAEVRMVSHPAYHPLVVAPWPQKKVIYVSFAFTRDFDGTDEELKHILLRALRMRDSWLFSVGPFLSVVGFLMLSIGLLLDYGGYTGMLAWVRLGFVMAATGFIVPYLLHGIIVRRLDVE